MSTRLTKARPEDLHNASAELLRDLRADYATAPRPAPGVVSDGSVPYGWNRPSDAAFRLFAITSADWFREMTQITKAAGIRHDEHEDYRRELVGHGYATVHAVKTFRPGGVIKILLPTDAGEAKLRDARVPFMPVLGDAPHGPDGDATHIFYQNKIAQRLRKQEWTTRIEMMLKEKRADVGAIRGPSMHAYEVVNEGLEKELHNLTADLEDGWQKVVFCVGNMAIQSELVDLIENQLGATILEHVELRLLPSFR
ncbi:MAG: hypothetical protein AB1806_05070 [Acidobacteriota bacterium]